MSDIRQVNDKMTDEELINSILGEHEEKKKKEISSDEILGVPDDAGNDADVKTDEKPEPVDISMPPDEDGDVPPDETDDGALDEEPDEDTDDDDSDEDDASDEEDEPRPRRKKKKRGAGRLIFALVLVTLVISVAVLSAVAVITVSTEILGLSRVNEQRDVEIPENSGTEAISQILVNEVIIEKPLIFRLYSRIKGADGTYMAGVHELNPNMTYSDVIEALQKEPENIREFVTITFVEGVRLIDAAAQLEEAGVCNAQDFIRAFNSTKVGFEFEEMVKPSTMKFYKMEGYFFPDTYDFYLEEDPKTVVRKVFKNFDHRVTPDYYGRMKDVGLTLEETITLASIVQREASDPRDMKYVASVFLNRMHNKDEFPKLQSDPTRIYVEEVVSPNLEIYSGAICDAYNTYKSDGLPPGPICNPGLDAIEAVLYPRDTDYYFFCSNVDTGEFFYAETLEEHEENLKKAGLR